MSKFKKDDIGRDSVNKDCLEKFTDVLEGLDGERDWEQHTNLNYIQRKTLRRIGRGKSISNGMMNDPIIRECFTINAPDAPIGEDINIVSWCDWEAEYRWAIQHPQLTPYGQKLLSELEAKESK